jgi:hypothetical protein
MNDQALLIVVEDSGLWDPEVIKGVTLVSDSAHGKLDAVDIQAGTVAHEVSGVPVKMLAIGSGVEYKSPVGTSEYGVVDRVPGNGICVTELVATFSVIVTVLRAVTEDAVVASTSSRVDEMEKACEVCLIVKIVVG